jgi:hypothetical protein
MSKIDVSFFDFKIIAKRLSPAALEDVLQRARVVVSNPEVERCDYCKQIPLTRWRGGRKYCNRACKQKAYRQRKEKIK